MALAEYFSKNHVAASQLIAGYNPDWFTEHVVSARVGITFGHDAANSAEGRLLLDFLMRLLARFYPSLSIRAPEAESLRESLMALGARINPLIEWTDDAAIEIVVGTEARPQAEVALFAGCDSWNAFLSSNGNHATGDTSNPVGAGIAACLASAAVFRFIFLGDMAVPEPVVLNGFTRERTQHDGPSIEGVRLAQHTALVGCGAIGNGAVWTLANAPLQGSIHLVDAQAVELSNMQRYTLTERSDENRGKVELAASQFKNALSAVPNPMDWASFVSKNGYRWDNVLVALDTARDRMAVQATLPQWIANAWTQIGDLGVSTHAFVGPGACLSCLYIPRGPAPNADELIAQALGIPEKTIEVRNLLAQNLPPSKELLNEIAARLSIAPEMLVPFQEQPIRKLYVDGLCGGALLSQQDQIGNDREMHVPLAHQSALAGILLAAVAIKHLIAPEQTRITRIDLLREMGQFVTQPALKDETVRCICQDSDYISVYAKKYNEGPLLG